MSLPRQLHAASLPFVARTFRGGRKLRYAALSLLLALISCVLGVWLALGSGRLEHELRVGFGLERPKYVQESVDFRIFVEDPRELPAIRRAVEDMRTPEALARLLLPGADGPPGHWQVASALEGAVDVVAFAATASTDDPELRDLQLRARALQQRLRLPTDSPGRAYMSWHEPDDVTRIRNVVLSELRPEVGEYASPLRPIDAVRVTGLIAGGVVLLMLMLFAPVIAGTQMAQEVHENTLQPLTGTALSARELVVGMSVGPYAAVALLAAPQALLLLAAALAAGHALPALGMLAVAAAGGMFLTMLAQLVGLALGRQRTPGIIGVALLGVLVPLSMFGLALAVDLPSRATGMLALLPQAAASHMLLEGFIPAGTWMRAPGVDVADLQTAVAVGALGMLCFAGLGLRALERRVGDLAPTALNRGEALLGALVSVVLIHLANPWRDLYDPGQFYLLNFGIALVPLATLLMMRVPQGDTPLALRRIPVAALLGEFAAGVALSFAVSFAYMGLARFTLLGSPVALFYFAWTVLVAGLLTIRVAALPMTLAAKLWAFVCAVGLAVAFVHCADWAHHPRQDLQHVLEFARVSPLLGVVQAALLVVIPASLLRALRRPQRVATPEG
jgi:hypothetical protein